MVLKVIGGIAALIAMALYGALAVTLGWQWFITPFGLPEIGYAHALGLSAMFTLWTSNVDSSGKPISFTDALTRGFIKITVVIGLMWIYSKFM